MIVVLKQNPNRHQLESLIAWLQEKGIIIHTSIGEFQDNTRKSKWKLTMIPKNAPKGRPLLCAFPKTGFRQPLRRWQAGSRPSAGRWPSG